MTAPAIMLTREQEVSLFAQWRAGDEKARETILLAYLPLVRRIANRYRTRLSYQDLYQEGLLGLMKALDKFEPERGLRFGTCAIWWVRAAIGDHLHRTSRIVRPRMSRAGKRDFSRGDIHREISLQMPVGRPQKGTELTTLSDFLPDAAPLPDEAAEAAIDGQHRRARLAAIINGLDPRSRFIIKRRFLAEHEATLEELAGELAVSKERVRQIQNAALAKMREGVEA